ncbi:MULTISPECIES: VanZ family protein [Terrisporobacter]|uniref:VanZ family protein n=1 Tax=Terrisporobacter muris TaxID=2963284 RepID=A0A9X2MF20_9FIRM|nr:MULTISPECIES: VanZ family protein [Terrisporobacter]MCR1824590.1 VanZ family protein [Terrisporobacter muris]MDY3372755.1 VanZ family protein [Terrisporobacter othiniensis]
MKGLLSLDLSIIFILIFMYLFSRISINIKHKNTSIVKELFLLGFVLSILMILTLNTYTLWAKALLFVPLGFFTFYCFEGSTKDTLIICVLMIAVVQIALFLDPGKVASINDVILNIVGGLVGIFVSDKLIKKTQLRFC